MLFQLAANMSFEVIDMYEEFIMLHPYYSSLLLILNKDTKSYLMFYVIQKSCLLYSMVNVFRNNLFQINILRFPKSFFVCMFQCGNNTLSVFLCPRHSRGYKHTVDIISIQYFVFENI